MPRRRFPMWTTHPATCDYCIIQLAGADCCIGSNSDTGPSKLLHVLSAPGSVHCQAQVLLLVTHAHYFPPIKDGSGREGFVHMIARDCWEKGMGICLQQHTITKTGGVLMTQPCDATSFAVLLSWSSWLSYKMQMVRRMCTHAP